MALAMLLKFTLLVKFSVTHVACEAVLSCVAGMVIISSLCVGEGFGTIVTLILDSLMFIHVNFVRVVVVVSLATLLTIKVELSSVQLLVSLKTDA